MKFSFSALKCKVIIYIFSLISIFVSESCTTVTRVPSGKFSYFKSKENSYPAYIDIQEPNVTLIQKGDILGIIVSSLNLESNDAINFTNINTLPVSVFSGNVGGGGQPLGYVVDSLGYVNIPFVGKLALGGISPRKAEELITAELVKKIKSPVVNIRFMNHKFSVLGEVGNVGTFNLLDDKTTILDAVALAGDLTLFAKRDSIVIIRNGQYRREINVVNLTDKSIFSSPYYYLRNNDIIYVEPNGDKTTPERPFKQLPPAPLALQRTTLYLSMVSFLFLFINLFK